MSLELLRKPPNLNMESASNDMESMNIEHTESTYVIIPAYNEELRIGEVIKKTKPYCSNIIVVDDGSRDNSYGEAERWEVIVLRHITNLGKGAALKTGIDYAIDAGAKRIIVMDADGQHNPKDIPRLLEQLEDKDIVFTFREKLENMPAILRFGNTFITQAMRITHGINLKDTQVGFRAMTADTYKKIRWESSNYEMESEMIANVGRHKLKYAEIPIDTVYADRYKGTTVLDGMRIVIKIIWWRVTGWF